MATTQLPQRWAPAHAGRDLLAGLRYKRFDAHVVPDGSDEIALLAQHVRTISKHIGPHARVVIVGGDAQLARTLMHGLERASSYALVDMDFERLQHTTHMLRSECLDADVVAVIADPLGHFDVPVPQHAWLKTLVTVPGAVLSRLDAPAAQHLFAERHAADRMLLVGVHESADLEDYHSLAERSLAALTDLNRTHGATFDASCFEPLAVANGNRIELHLASRCQQIVRIAGQTVALTETDSILTGTLHQHGIDAMRSILGAAGWRPRQVFTAAERPQRLWLCEPM
jgi:uncharacterized SAM-dependent methyltransferase